MTAVAPQTIVEIVDTVFLPLATNFGKIRAPRLDHSATKGSRPTPRNTDVEDEHKADQGDGAH
jgi:hypothetical protein